MSPTDALGGHCCRKDEGREEDNRLYRLQKPKCSIPEFIVFNARFVKDDPEERFFKGSVVEIIFSNCSEYNHQISQKRPAGIGFRFVPHQ